MKLKVDIWVEVGLTSNLLNAMQYYHFCTLAACCNAGQTVWRHTHMYGISPFVVLVLCCRYVNMYKIQMLWITWHTKKLVNMWTIQVFLWELSWSTQIMYYNYTHITYVPCLIVLKATFFRLVHAYSSKTKAEAHDFMGGPVPDY